MKEVNGRFPTVRQWFAISVRHRWSSALPVLLVASVGAFILALILVPLVSAWGAVDGELRGGSAALNTITIEADADNSSPRLTSTTLSQIGNLPGVDDVTPSLTATIYAGDGSGWDGVVHVIRPSLLPPGVSEKTAEAVVEHGIIAPRVVDGVNLEHAVGTMVSVEYTKGVSSSTGVLASTRVKLLGVYDEKWTGYGPSALLASSDFVVWLNAQRYGKSSADIEEREGYPGVFVHVVDASQVDVVMQQLRNLGFDPSKDSDRAGSLPDLLGFLPALFGLVMVVTVATVAMQTSAAVREAARRRVKEFALLRTRGFSPSDIRRLLVLEIVVGVVAGCISGLALGVVAGALIRGVLVPQPLRGEVGFVLVHCILGGVAIVIGLAVTAAVAALVATRRQLRTDPFLLLARD